MLADATVRFRAELETVAAEERAAAEGFVWDGPESNSGSGDGSGDGDSESDVGVPLLFPADGCRVMAGI
jgi:hypothetical protein